MKHLLTLVAVFAITTLSYSQSPNWWKVDGNSNGSSSTFLGTTNAQPLIFKTNNATRATFSSTGAFQINSLVGVGNRLLQTDANGNILPFAMGNSNEVLYGNGTWGTLPNIPTQLWQTNGGSLYYSGGNVGIGTNSPLVSLDVIGDARISNNLYVGGGVIITEKVNANSEVLTGKMRADSIMLDSTRAVYGYSIFKDKVKLENKLQVVGNTQIDGDFKVNGSFAFGNNKSLSYQAATGTTPELLGWGVPSSAFASIPFTDPCLSTISLTGLPSNIFAGQIQCFGNNTSTGAFNTMLMGYNGSDGVIEMVGDNSNGGGTHATGPDLFVNRNCGKNVFVCTGDAGGNVALCTGNGGGIVSTGKNIEIGEPTRDLNFAINVNATNKNGLVLKTNQQGLEITTTHTGDYGYNTKILVNRDLTKGFAVYNTTTNKENFAVYGNGDAYFAGNIGIGTGNFTGYKLSVNGSIRAKDIVVETGWSDFVFDVNYKRMNLLEKEKFYLKNKHLPNIDSELEIEAKGLQMGKTMNGMMQNIEENTLDLVELYKKVVLIEQENIELKIKVAQLEKEQNEKK